MANSDESHPLAPFKAKLDRADKSLRTFNTEYRRFSKRKPLRASIKVDFQSGWNTAYIAHAEPLPPLFGVLLGESLYHGRSSLEHLVWALVKANRKKPGQHNTFPIWRSGTAARFMEVTNRSASAKKRAGALRGVPKAARTLIESLQPYRAPDPSAHFLSILDEMARDDRHHALHGSFTAGRGENIEHLLRPAPGVHITDYETLLEFGRELVEDTKLARFRVTPLTRYPQVDVEGDLPTLIAFGDRPSRLVRVVDFHEINTNLRKLIGPFEEFL
jgi:hypothetical protein